MILQQAQERGIVYDEKDGVFKLKRAERLVFSLKDQEGQNDRKLAVE